MFAMSICWLGLINISHQITIKWLLLSNSGLLSPDEAGLGGEALSCAAHDVDCVSVIINMEIGK